LPSRTLRCVGFGLRLRIDLHPSAGLTAAVHLERPSNQLEREEKTGNAKKEQERTNLLRRNRSGEPLPEGVWAALRNIHVRAMRYFLSTRDGQHWQIV
jgi:hypothetical protein